MVQVKSGGIASTRVSRKFRLNALLILTSTVFAGVCFADDVGSALGSILDSSLPQVTLNVPKFDIAKPLQLNGLNMMQRPSAFPQLTSQKRQFAPYEKEVQITKQLGGVWGGAQTVSALYQGTAAIENQYADNGIKPQSFQNIVTQVAGLNPPDSMQFNNGGQHPGGGGGGGDQSDDTVSPEARAKLDVSGYLATLTQKRDQQQNQIDDDARKEQQAYQEAVQNQQLTNALQQAANHPGGGSGSGSGSSSDDDGSDSGGAGDIGAAPPAPSTDFLEKMVGLGNQDSQPVLPSTAPYTRAAASNDFSNVVSPVTMSGIGNRAPASMGMMPNQRRNGQQSNPISIDGQSSTPNSLAFADGKKNNFGMGSGAAAGGGKGVAAGMPSAAGGSKAGDKGDVTLDSEASDPYTKPNFIQGDGIFGSGDGGESFVADAAPVGSKEETPESLEGIADDKGLGMGGPQKQLYASNLNEECGPKVPPLFCHRPKPCGNDLKDVVGACVRFTHNASATKAASTGTTGISSSLLADGKI
jgi:hypothetical protein